MKGGFGEEVGTVELWPDIGGGWGTRRYPRGVWLAPVTPRHRLNGAACPLFWHQTDSAHSSFSFAASPWPPRDPLPPPPPFVHLLSRAFVLSGLLDDSCTVARINCSSRNWSWSLLCSIRGWKISATVRADASPAEKLPPSTVGELEREEKILSTWLFSTRENVRRSIFYL